MTLDQESDYRKRNNMPLGSVPKPRPIHVNGLSSGSGSDMDLGTDSDEEVYGGQYSVESSPQDDKIRVAVETNYSTSKFKQVGYFRMISSSNVMSLLGNSFC